MDENILRTAQSLGIDTANKTEEQVAAEIAERQKELGSDSSRMTEELLRRRDELAVKYFEQQLEAQEALPRTSKEKREAQKRNPDFYNYEEGRMSGADEKKLENQANSAGMSVEDYTSLSALDRFKADQVAPQQREAERTAKREAREINPYNDGQSGPQLEGNVESPFELKRSLRRENEKTRKEMEAAGAKPDEIRAALASETDMSDAAFQRWKDLTTKGTVEDRRAYWAGAADRMKAEGRSVGTVTRMETPDGEVIAEREQNDGRLRWADGSVGGPADTSNPAFARSSDLAQRADMLPTKANVPVVYSGAGNNDPVIDPYTGQQAMTFAPRPAVVEGLTGRAVSGIYGEGRTSGAEFSDEQESEIAAARTPAGFVQTASGPAATKRDPLVDVQEEEKKKKDRKIAEDLSRRQQPGGLS